ncbi:AMP-binding protein [Paraburkholderia sp. Tr-20389]|uniref:long-chain-fatty-acid--CoA ligase n=1 Tax=Paraburkholderia sp. Tr-20389 TaxID=2703903 RepID=UPI0019821B70|nr:AMP-binding protein [Paraburkholderia sp. Tr-20389]
MTLSPFWPARLSQHVEAPRTSLYYNLEVSATRYPDKTAIHYYGTAISYAQLRRDVDALAGFLQHRCGVKRGDRVALYMQNSPQFIAAYYAILRADAAVVPINPMSLQSELRHIVEDCGTRVMLLADELYENASPLFGELLHHVVVARYAEHLHDTADLPLPAVLSEPRHCHLEPGSSAQANGCDVILWRDALDTNEPASTHQATPSDLAIVPYSSGTTAAPKGCMHTHRSAMHVIAASIQWCQLSQDAIVLCTAPLFHVTGMQQCMNTAVLSGATMVVTTRWDPRCAALLIERHRVSVWIAIATMMVDFMSQPDLDRYDLHSLKCLAGGGAAMPEALAQRIQSRLGIPYMEGYGLSETIAATHINPPDRCKRQCLGIPLQDTESRVIDPHTLQPVETGTPGEIVTCGPQVFEGYWGRPEATRDAFIELDGRRYLRTGDLGYIDEDGYFFMIDRLKRIINVSGYKVSPAEVETMLFEHPAVQEACVIAVRDPRRGESVKACVVLRAGCHADAQQIIEWARTRMAAYKVPQSIEFLESLPRTASGKVQWRELQQRELSSA